MAHELSQTSRVDGVAHHAIAAARVTHVPRQDAIAVSDIPSVLVRVTYF